jgi:hypothetical protein
LTPTAFTQLSTTASRLFFRRPGVTSCWYCPLRVHLDELRERVLEPARDRDGAPDREIEVGELLAGDVAGAVHAGAGFAHHDDGDPREPELAQRRAQERLGLTARGAVAHRDGRDVRGLHGQAEHLLRRLALALRREVDDVAAEVRARLAHDGELAPRPDAGVHPQHALRAVRGGEQELAEVLGEDVDGGGVGDVP